MALGGALAALAVGGALNLFAQPIKRGPSIKFSDPRSETVTTNLNALTEEKKNNLRRLEEDLTRSFRMLEGDDASGARRMLPRPPPGPIIQNRKVRELLDKKDWVFDTPEDRMSGLTAEEMMNVSQLDDQGREKSSIPVFERYYDSMGRDGLGATNRASGSIGDSREARDTFEAQQAGDASPSDPLQARIKDAERGLRQTMSEDSGLKLLPSLNDASVMPDLFDSETAKVTQSKAQDSRLNQFKQMFQTDLSKTATPSFSSLRPLGGSLGGDRFGSAGGGAVKAAPSLSLPSPATPGSASLSRSGLAASPGLTGTDRSTAESTVSRRAPPSSPFPDIPRRKF